MYKKINMVKSGCGKYHIDPLYKALLVSKHSKGIQLPNCSLFLLVFQDEFLPDNAETC